MRHSDYYVRTTRGNEEIELPVDMNRKLGLCSPHVPLEEMMLQVSSLIKAEEFLVGFCTRRMPRRPLGFYPLPPLRQRPKTKGVQLDESGGVLVIVSDRAFLEGHEVLVVERMGTVAADHVDAALV
jgi:hypothetical protein